MYRRRRLSCWPRASRSPPGVAFPILDGGDIGGNPGFGWLSPNGDTPDGGEFDSSFLPFITVEICEWANEACVGDPIRSFTSEGEASERLRITDDGGGQHYHVNWHTKDDGLDADRDYRIRVLVGELDVGHADVDVVDKPKDGKGVDQSQFVVLRAGGSLSIKFTLTDALDGAKVLGNEGGVVTLEGGAVTLDLPANALGGNAPITVLRVEDVADFPPDSRLIEGLFDFGPGGTKFDTPVRLTIQFDPNNNPTGDQDQSLAIFHLENGIWVEVAGSVMDGSSNTVTCEISGFSLYGVGLTQCDEDVDDARRNVAELLQAEVRENLRVAEISHSTSESLHGPAIAQAGTFFVELYEAIPKTGEAIAKGEACILALPATPAVFVPVCLRFLGAADDAFAQHETTSIAFINAFNTISMLVSEWRVERTARAQAVSAAAEAAVLYERMESTCPFRRREISIEGHVDALLALIYDEVAKIEELDGNIEWGEDTLAEMVEGMAGLDSSIGTLSDVFERFNDLCGSCLDQEILSPDELCSNHPGSAIATFEDANLEVAVRRSLGVGVQEPLTCGLLGTLTNLGKWARYAGIRSLVGIQNLTSLTILNLDTNSITDISPLSGLTSLNHLNLSNNSITDVTLSGMPYLGQLIAPNNSITNLSLSGMPLLDYLNVQNNSITGFTLSGMPDLRHLNAFFNSITDISSLGSGMPRLLVVTLGSNHGLSDIQALIDNPGIGPGDRVLLSNTSVLSTDIQKLLDKGVIVGLP